jgi:hypothetical protein
MRWPANGYREETGGEVPVIFVPAGYVPQGYTPSLLIAQAREDGYSQGLSRPVVLSFPRLQPASQYWPWPPECGTIGQEPGPGRLEITERAESTVREERDGLLKELEEERQQHLQDVERERSERLEAQEGLEQLSQERAQVQDETEQLRAELEAERSKGFWARPFGG